GNFGGTSRRTSGYLMVAFGSKNFLSVSAIPWTSPMPGSGIIAAAPSSGSHHEDRRGRHEQVEERGRQEPFPGKAHQLVDPHARQRPAHPDESEHETVGLEHKPEQPGDPVEAHERDAEDRADRDEVENDESGQQ